MKIHEYQAKAILSRYGVTTPRGETESPSLDTRIFIAVPFSVRV